MIHGYLNRLRLASDAPFATVMPDISANIWTQRQLNLIEEEEIPGVVKIRLQVCNPNLPGNIIQYDYLESAYVFVPPDPTIVLYNHDPMLIRKAILAYTANSLKNSPQKSVTKRHKETAYLEGEEGNIHSNPPKILQESSTIDSDEESMPETGSQQASYYDTQGEEETNNVNFLQASKGEDGSDSESEVAEAGSSKVNLFSHCERGVQTTIIRNKVASSTTVTTVVKSFSSNANFYEIAVAYDVFGRKTKPEINAKIERKKDESGAASKQLPFTPADPASEESSPEEVSTELSNRPGLTPEGFQRLKHSANVIERMLSQSMFDDLAQDLKYFEDAADDFRENEGTLLPLWRFVIPTDAVRGTKTNSSGTCVRSLVWNPKYFDLLAVGFGSEEPDFDGGGLVCLYSLKNAFHPEKVFKFPVGVTFLDFHAERPYLLGVTTEDGSVYIYSLHSKLSGLLYESSGLISKDSSNITQIKWVADKIESCPTFVTVSFSGTVHLWLISNKKLVQLLVVTLSFDGPISDEVNRQDMQGCCSCVSVHPRDSNLIIVGTTEGLVYFLSLESDVTPSKTYSAHHLPITSLQWNPFHINFFATTSYDSSLKIWDNNQSNPLLVFKLADPLTDVAWSPFSSTTLATISSAGKVYVFDLSVKKFEPICVQRLAPRDRPKLTRIAFNKYQPLIIVGEESGFIGTYKLSPNLRKTTKVLEEERRMEVEVTKLERLKKLLSL
ncbi:dynein axonemal intermediate chain 1-like isoform X2 [Artemia franciscana]